MKPFIQRQLARMHKDSAQHELRQMLRHNSACQLAADWQRDNNHRVAQYTMDVKHGDKNKQRRARRRLKPLLEARGALERSVAHCNGGEPYDESAIERQAQALERAFQQYEQVTELVH